MDQPFRTGLHELSPPLADRRLIDPLTLRNPPLSASPFAHANTIRDRNATA
jgi:hypothetical protein